MIPDYFEFYNPTKILCGNHSLENIPYELERLGTERTLILISKKMREQGILEMIGGRYHALIESDIPEYPSFDTVDALVQKARTGGCDSILAVGGTSVISMAKAVRAMLSVREKSFRQLVGSEWPERGKTIPFLIVPTDIDIGSECIPIVDIWDEQNKRKQEIVLDSFLPDAAVIDCRAVNVPSIRWMAAAGVDALSHAIEAYTGLQKNPLSDAYAKSAVRLIGQNLLSQVHHPKEGSYRMAMACASLMAGVAVSNSMESLVHVASQALTEATGLPHGESVGLMLPRVMEWQMERCGQAYGELLCEFSGVEYYAQIPYQKRGQEFVKVIKEMLMHLHQKCDIPICFEDAQIGMDARKQAVERACNDRALLISPKSVSRKDLEMIFLQD